MISYDKTYLSNAMENLGAMFEYSINTLNCDPNSIMEYFIVSGLAEQFGRGDCSIIAGISGTELAIKTLIRTGWTKEFTQSEISISSCEYWAGWSLAYYQWQSGQSFKEIYNRGIRIKEIISMFYPLHEADLTTFCNRLDTIYPINDNTSEKLRMARIEHGLTQAKLSEISGVPIRLIRAYEQGTINPIKGEFRTISNLEKVLRIRLIE